MLEYIEFDHALSKHEVQDQLPVLQQRIYDLEVEVIASKIPVAIVFEGWAGTSKIGSIGALTRRLDPRGLRIHPIAEPTMLDAQFPWLQRFWQRIPAYGEIAIFDRSWYREVLSARVRKNLNRRAYEQRCAEIVTFERQLTDDGTVLIKFALHISKKEQERRFKELLANRLTAIQVTKSDLWQQRHYDRVLRVSDDLFTRTSMPNAPWLVVPSGDRLHAQVMVLEAVVQRLEQHIGTLGASPTPPPAAPEPAPAEPEPIQPGVLATLDLSPTISDNEYDRSLELLQAKMYLLGLEAYRQKRPTVLVFEGWDAAGKGGTIKRITEPLDPRAYVVHAIGKPEGEDKQHHYLYRFWRRLPQRGQIAIFDRSWYGRVLVERVEGFARPDEWQRAYAEINEFEQALVDDGAILCKFWLHLSQEEQLKRFHERKAVRYKAWKLTDEDWRNRDKWPQYEAAVDEMVQRTSSANAPWSVVASEDKRFARIEIIREIVQRMESELGKVKI